MILCVYYNPYIAGWYFTYTDSIYSIKIHRYFRSILLRLIVIDYFLVLLHRLFYRRAMFANRCYYIKKRNRQ